MWIASLVDTRMWVVFDMPLRFYIILMHLLLLCFHACLQVFVVSREERIQLVSTVGVPDIVYAHVVNRRR